MTVAEVGAQIWEACEEGSGCVTLDVFHDRRKGEVWEIRHDEMNMRWHDLPCQAKDASAPEDIGEAPAHHPVKFRLSEDRAVAPGMEVDMLANEH